MAQLQHKTCIICGMDLLLNKRKYCSRKCYGLAMRRAHKICKHCHKIFYPCYARQVFCSKKCYSNHHRIIKKCVLCGRVIEKNRKASAKYCSKDCESTARITKKLKKCAFCKTPFWVNLSQEKRNVGKYCSSQCSGLARKTSVKVLCPTCGKVFDVQPNRLKNDKGKFCSLQCYRNAKETSIEKAIRKQLGKRSIFFVQQHKIGYWYADFFLPLHSIIIECDGDYWHSTKHQQGKDKARDAYMTKLGYKIVRLKECDIRENADKLIEKMHL